MNGRNSRTGLYYFFKDEKTGNSFYIKDGKRIDLPYEVLTDEKGRFYYETDNSNEEVKVYDEKTGSTSYVYRKPRSYIDPENPTTFKSHYGTTAIYYNDKYQAAWAKQNKHALVKSNTTAKHVAFIGERNVGKTSICRQLNKAKFDEKADKNTQDIISTAISLVCDGQPHSFFLRDVPGQCFTPEIEGYNSQEGLPLKESLARESKVVVVLYDIGNRASYERAINFILEYRAAEAEKNRKNVNLVLDKPIILVGNKADLSAEKRQVTYAEACQHASKMYNGTEIVKVEDIQNESAISSISAIISASSTTATENRTPSPIAPVLPRIGHKAVEAHLCLEVSANSKTNLDLLTTYITKYALRYVKELDVKEEAQIQADNAANKATEDKEKEMLLAQWMGKPVSQLPAPATPSKKYKTMKCTDGTEAQVHCIERKKLIDDGTYDLEPVVSGSSLQKFMTVKRADGTEVQVSCSEIPELNEDGTPKLNLDGKPVVKYVPAGVPPVKPLIDIDPQTQKKLDEAGEAIKQGAAVAGEAIKQGAAVAGAALAEAAISGWGQLSARIWGQRTENAGLSTMNGSVAAPSSSSSSTASSTHTNGATTSGTHAKPGMQLRNRPGKSD